jgi:pimeloyl-ACP methyl ester carboxylesterase
MVLLPGITGSVLQKDGSDVWALSGSGIAKALGTLGGSIDSLLLEGDDPDSDDLGDGVTAPRLIGDTHLIPGLWKIDGYTKVSQAIQSEFDVTPGVNFFEFPYDWRRDNRVHARRLAREGREWLKRWRQSSGNDDAKLILIGHSMGGLVSRAFLELEEGWRDTRLLLTFGTPYRGSLNAVGFLVNGMKKRLGPITLANLTDLLRSFTSVYQLLPVYECVDTGDGTLHRVAELDLPGVDPERARAALAFHHAIRDAVEEHRKDQAYLDGGYTIKPLTGYFQPTAQSALVTGGGVDLLRTYEGTDRGGDGTVPAVSATPLELSNMNREVYVREKHASVQNADFSLDQVIGLIQNIGFDQAQIFAPGSEVALDVEDAYTVEEPVTVRAQAGLEWAELAAAVRDADTNAVVADGPLGTAADGWREAAFGPLSAGTYRVTVTGGPQIASVTDVFAVVEPGADVG